MGGRAEQEVETEAPDRRFFIKNSVVFAAAVAAGAGSDLARAQTRPLSDVDILNFALNLEYLESEFYLRGLTGQGLTAAETTGVGNLGTVTGGRQVNFTDDGVRQILMEITQNERNHTNFIRSQLGSAAIARPSINYTDAFNALGMAAGIGPFDPFANQTNFIIASFLFEETGQTAYKGSGRFLQNKSILDAAAGILSVEAYHAGALKLLTYQAGQSAINTANAAIGVKIALGGPADQPLVLNGQANLVPTDGNSISFGRTPQQVLNIVYEGGSANKFGFFPNRVNGTITTAVTPAGTPV